MTVDFLKADPDVLKAALERAGLTVIQHDAERGYIYFRDKIGYQGRFANGQFTSPETIKLDTDLIKREYSNEAVERAAKKYKFTLKKQAGNKYTLARRSY